MNEDPLGSARVLAMAMMCAGGFITGVSTAALVWLLLR